MPTENAGNGIAAKWNFHVVLAVKLSNSDPAIQNTLLILDPALSAKPMTKANFHQMLSADSNSHMTGFVTCDANAISLKDMCINGIGDQFKYLQSKFEINIFLNR